MVQVFEILTLIVMNPTTLPKNQVLPCILLAKSAMVLVHHFTRLLLADGRSAC